MALADDIPELVTELRQRLARIQHLEEIWIIHVVWKLLDGDRSVRELFAFDPFGGAPPKWVRIQRFAYHLEPTGSPAWWTRDHEQRWLPPVSLDTAWFREALADSGWPSPSLR